MTGCLRTFACTRLNPVIYSRKPSKMADPVSIAIIGSSTAAGQGADPPEKSWVNRYRAYLKSLHPENKVHNLALGGLQTFQLQPNGHKPSPARPLPDPERNITKALSLRPDAVIVNAPSNDAAAFYGTEEQLANFDRIIQVARQAGVLTWICTTQPRVFSPKQIDIQVQLKDAILNRYGAQTLNFWDALALPDHLPDPRFTLGDGAHLNNAGHARLFEIAKSRNLPAAIAAWKKQQRQATLKFGHRLEIPRLVGGLVHIEVYDAWAQLRWRGSGKLPMTVPGNLWKAGTYWVRVSGTGFHRFLSWVKSG